MGKKFDYKLKIYQSIHENEGLTVTDIADRIDISRNTVYKYLEILEGEEAIDKKKIGMYTLYFSREKSILNKEVIISFFKGLLVNLKAALPNKEGLFQEFGRKIADTITLPFTKSDLTTLQALKNESEESIIESLGVYIKHFNIMHDIMAISDIEIDNEAKKAVITFIESTADDEYIYYFYLIAGLIEKKLSKYIGRQIKIEILEHETIELKENSFIKISFDFEVLLPQMDIEEIPHDEIPDVDVIDVNLIKESINPLTLSYILHASVLGKKILILFEKDNLQGPLMSFLEFIFRGSFKIDLPRIVTPGSYQKSKNIFKEHIVIGEKAVFNDKNKILSKKEVRVENVIVQKFLAEFRSGKSSLNVLRNEIMKAHIFSEVLSRQVKSILENDNEKEVDSKLFFDYLESTFNTKISLVYMKFLVEIVESYFEVDIPEVWKFFIYRR